MKEKIWSRIDRVLMSTKWLERLNLKLWVLERSISDHCPLLLLEDGRDSGTRPFLFINAWTFHPKVEEHVKKSWEDTTITGWASFVIMNKLKTWHSVLKKWNIEVFGNVTHALKAAEEELHAIDLVAEFRSFEEDKVKRRREVRKAVWSLSKREEWMGRQKSRLNWSLKGDKNTRFFHVIATSRQNRNLLNSIEVDEELNEDPKKVKHEVFNHFRRRFSEELKYRPKLHGFFWSIGHDNESDGLVAPFSEEEILRAVKEVASTCLVFKNVGKCLKGIFCNSSRTFMIMGV
ncbi:uncharacterized protein LOC114302886 [Camellia sinensis]|uniref:uncharacterized protein LOC114302886 n=1 Tax=Camellia sinensis TaxID=4442 RepID=UPI0010361286|nr:uncharacterized protein LOC114302886 [Camellia sinensis]